MRWSQRYKEWLTLITTSHPDKEFWLGWLFIIVVFIIETADNLYTIPKMKASTLQSAVDCHDDANKCWIKNRHK